MSATRGWPAQETKIEHGAWDKHATRNVALVTALEPYNDYAKIRDGTCGTYDAPSLTLQKRALGANTLLPHQHPAARLFVAASNRDPSAQEFARDLILEAHAEREARASEMAS